MLSDLADSHNLSHRVSVCFDELFFNPYNTRLVGGAHEPVYIPAGYQYLNNTALFARICFTHDYAASALHECAHWCVAGEERRGQLDYGYWYAPDGRTVEQQSQFEQVEVRPQALEWVFAKALGIKFQVSADNLDQGLAASPRFKSAVYKQVVSYLTQALPERAGMFALALHNEFNGGDFTNAENYTLAELD